MEIKRIFDTKQQVITKRKNLSYSIDSLGGKILMGKILIKYSITYSKTGFTYHIEIGFLFVPNFVLLNIHNDFLSRQNNCDQISYAENRFLKNQIKWHGLMVHKHATRYLFPSRGRWNGTSVAALLLNHIKVVKMISQMHYNGRNLKFTGFKKKQGFSSLIIEK